MEARLVGTGGSGGWPRAGCGCASCAIALAAGRVRAPARLLVDGVLPIKPGGPGGAALRGAGYRVERVPGGWDVTGPGGARLLVGDQRGEQCGEGNPATVPPDGAGPYDLVLLDMLGKPAQLGALRHRGLVRTSTVIAVWPVDHRVSSEAERARRARFWDVIVPEDGDVLTAASPAATAATAGTQSGPSQPRRVLVLGGARSGKSRHAELRLAAEPRVTYLAAGPYPPGAQPAEDTEWTERVAAHRARRPPWWQTVESLDAAATVRSESGAIVFDGAGTWLAAVMEESGAWAQGEGDRGPTALGRAEARVAARVDELLAAWRQTRARVVAVSDEVGSSVHPPTRAGRMFRDQLGWLNQRLAAESEETVLMVAGRALTLPS